MKLAIESYVEETYGDTDYDMSDCTVKLQGITAAMESVSSLEKLKKTFLKNKDKPRSKSAIKIGKLALESIKKDTGIFSSAAIVSMECFTEDQVSLEGINDVIKAIIDAVVRTFKTVWENLKKFIDMIARGLGLQKQKRKLDDVKTSIKEIKELKIKKALKLPKEKKEPTSISELGVLASFRYLNTELDEVVLKNEMEKLKKTIKDCGHLILTLEVCNINMAESVYNMQKDGVSKETLKNAFFATGAFYRQMGTQFEPDSTIDQYADIIQTKLGISIDSIDKRNTRMVPGLTRGNKVLVFCKLLRGDEDTDFQMINVNTSQSDTAKVNMKATTLDHLLSYAEACESTLDDYSDVLAAYALKSQSIQVAQGKIVHSLARIMNESSTGDVELDSSVRFMKALTVSLTKATIDLQKIFKYIDNATEDHVKILIDLRKHYYEQPT